MMWEKEIQKKKFAALIFEYYNYSIIKLLQINIYTLLI